MNAAISIVLWFATICLQNSPPAASETPKALIDNERATVWDLTWTPGKTPPIRHNHDFVTVYLNGGTFEITKPDGTSTLVKRKTDDVLFEPKGTSHSLKETTGSTTARTIEIELKDNPVQPLTNSSGYPDAFPRAGAKKLLENNRVTIWDTIWLPGKPVPRHFHAKDTIVVYLEDGALKATTPDGQSVVNEYVPGLTKFNPRNRAHTEELIRGREHAFAIELK